MHVRNETRVDAAPERVWAWLVRASSWPQWYPNAKHVRVTGGDGRTLTMGTEFRWRTFGVAIRSTVIEFEAPQRIAWTAFGLGVDACHAWLIEPVAGGTRILTEETQHGWAARLNTLFMPDRMGHYHQVWIENLGRQAALGSPP